MENQTRRGYSMPVAAEPRKPLIWAGIMSAGAVVLLVQCLRKPELAPALGVPLAVLMAALLLQFYSAFGKVHFVQEGIALTLFGLTLRRWSVEKIRCLCGVRIVYRRRHSRDEIFDSERTHSDWIAVCRLSREDVIARGAREFLTIGGAIPILGPISWDEDSFWLEWDAERLKAMQSLYPHADWLDTSRELVFDAQLREETRELWEY